MVAPHEIGAREDDISLLLLDLTQRIPNELLTHVVDYLPVSQLVLVSSVSKRFRAAITRDSRFRITIYIKVTHRNIDRKICFRQVARAHAILEYAIPERLPVAMIVVCEDIYPVGALATLRNYMCDSVFPMVGAALPMLVHLAVEIPNEHSDALQAVLLRPAPLLRDFELSRIDQASYLEDGSEYGSDDEPEFEDFTHVVPRNIFSGIAPQLQRVSFCNVDFAEGPIPALGSVCCVALRYDCHAPDIHISGLFPCVTDLEIEFEASEDTRERPTSIDYSGLCLDHLRIGDMSACRLLLSMTRSLDFTLIHAITYTSLNGCQYDNELLPDSIPGKTLLDSLPGDVSMCMRKVAEPDFDSEVEFRAMRDESRRVFRFVKFNCRAFRNFSIFAFRVVDIRLDYSFLDVMLDFECDLPVLRRLRLDLSKLSYRAVFIAEAWFGDSHVEDDNSPTEAISDLYLLRCPLLDAIAFTASDLGCKISPRQAASIGHAFGQSERPRPARARLEMFGVTFVEHARRDLLDLIFPHIVYHSRDEVLDWGENEEWPRT